MSEQLLKLQQKARETFPESSDSRFKDQIAALPTKLNEFGYDDFGFSPEWVKKAFLPAVWVYRYWFRCELFGVENIPEGRVLLISNHSGQIPIDGVMIGVGVLLEGNPPRILRSMVERWVPTLPFVSTFLTRIGQILGTPENARALLDKDEALLVFPEGTRGINKLWWDRYQLEQFGLGFMRLALETNTPIVPIAVVGAEEQLPSIGNLNKLASVLKMPAVPLLPQLMVPFLGWLPLPTKYRIYFGEPMTFEGDANDEDVVIDEKVQDVRKKIQSMLTYGLKNRRHIFW